jgi:hypothetical protein
MSEGNLSGAAHWEERARGRAILTICLLSALCWAIVIGIVPRVCGLEYEIILVKAIGSSVTS